MIRNENFLQKLEVSNLSPLAQLSAWAGRRYEMEKEGRQFELRTAFQHDRDRIVHSRAFRRLKHKTQVFIPYKNDHQRTRLTHTIEVTQLARTIARSLGLNEDLTEAIAMGHDVGHTPFGHVGERTLIQIMGGKSLKNVIPADLVKGSVGFKHNAQSLRVLDLLEARYAHKGLNLTDQTREGVLKHTKWKKWKDYPGIIPEGLNLERQHSHFEGQVVAIADEIAQQTHDLEDGMRGGIVKLQDLTHLELIKYLEKKSDTLSNKKLNSFVRQNAMIRALIHVLVVNAIHESAENLSAFAENHQIDTHEGFREKQEKISLCVSFNEEMQPMFNELSQFVYKNIIRSRDVKLNDESGQYFVNELFRLYYDDPTMLPWYILEDYRHDKKIKHLHEIVRFSSKDEVENETTTHYKNEPDFIRSICDYIAGMSNTYAIKEYERWVMPFHA